MSHSKPKHREDFEVAIICALALEYDAVSYVFDGFWDDDGDEYGRAQGDPNTYTTGRIGKYNVVLALLPHMGKANAASAAASMRSSYTRLRLVLLVGVCGGVPLDGHSALFLGDVVISQTVLQYDFGRQYPDGFVRKETIHDSLGRPNKDVRNLVAIFQTDRGQDKLQERTAHILQQIQNKISSSRRQGKYTYPGAQSDQVFSPQHRHKHHRPEDCICKKCLRLTDPVCEKAMSMSCADLGCSSDDFSHAARTRSQLLVDQANVPPRPEVHVGVIASGDLVLKSAVDRDRLHKETGAIGFEMEGAGVWDEVPCVVVKAVCDYADSHKHKGWQNYAAATAASATKAVLERYIRTDKVDVDRKPEVGAMAATSSGDSNTASAMGGPVFQGPVSGHNVIAGSTNTGGTTTIEFKS
jgi:nucleoside phosphorylase